MRMSNFKSLQLLVAGKLDIQEQTMQTTFLHSWLYQEHLNGLFILILNLDNKAAGHQEEILQVFND